MKPLRFAAPLLACAGLALCAATSVAAQEITLRVADSYPTTHINAINAKTWMDRVTELTDGKVAFEYFPAEQLGKSTDLLDAALNGIADIVYAPPLYISDRLPLSTIAALPLVGNISDEAALNDAWYKLVLEEINEAELLPQGVRAVRMQVTPAYQIMMRDGKAETLEDLKGKKLRSSGGVQEKSVEALGAIPTAIPAPDLYPAIQRGTVDGSLFNLPTANGYKLQEQLMWSTDNLNLGLFPVLYVINEDKWQELPEDVQQALLQGSVDVLPEVFELNAERQAEFQAALEAKGGGFYQISDEERARWGELLTDVRENWIEDMEARGLPGRKVYDRWTELLTK